MSRPLREYGCTKTDKRRRAAIRYADAEDQAEANRALDLLKKYGPKRKS
jgi:hypothetical protein